MPSEEKQVTYRTSNTYSTLNELTPKTENVWLCCHGLGFLSRYFIKNFNKLDPDKNYIIAPQAPSKYYQNSDFKYVGASWLTKERTRPETRNVLAYLDAIYKAEKIPADKSLILFGFSQGVSVIMRWMASRNIHCKLLVIYAGRMPVELNPGDFAFAQNTQVKLVYGNQDPYVTADLAQNQSELARAMFGDQLEVISFKGRHEMDRDVIANLVSP